MQKQSLFTMSILATAALAAGRFVGMMTGAHCAAAAKAQGVTQYAGAIGDAVAIDVLGTSIVEAGGAVAVGGPVKSDATGRAVAQAGAGEILGYAVTGAAAAGQKIEVLLTL